MTWHNKFCVSKRLGTIVSVRDRPGTLWPPLVHDGDAGVQDQMFPPELSKQAMERLRAQGNYVELFEIDGDLGHVDGVYSIEIAAEAIRGFLNRVERDAALE